ncbi:MAG: nitrite reductase (NAD(P)H) small subunit [Flavobacterium sp.]|nr:nitrite reductase (NAD(P)H) small subunit [Flavobacterium sp.]
MGIKKITWHKIAESLGNISFGANGMCVVEADGKKISLAKYQNELFAFAYKCPHASGIMANGCIDALGNAVCPLHRYKFSLKNGRNITGEGYFLKTYAVKITEQGVFIGFDENCFFNSL